MFKAGDKIIAFGNNGYIKSISPNGMFLMVDIENAPGIMLFELDGRLGKWTKEPVLKLVEEIDGILPSQIG